jgi:hypothetical protein
MGKRFEKEFFSADHFLREWKAFGWDLIWRTHCPK